MLDLFDDSLDAMDYLWYVSYPLIALALIALFAGYIGKGANLPKRLWLLPLPLVFAALALLLASFVGAMPGENIPIMVLWGLFFAAATVSLWLFHTLKGLRLAVLPALLAQLWYFFWVLFVSTVKISGDGP